MSDLIETALTNENIKDLYYDREAKLLIIIFAQ